MKILVIQTSRFGDLLQTTPMLHALRRRYPKASITVLSRLNVMDVYKDNPDVDHIELFNIEEFTKRMLDNTDNFYIFYVELRNAVHHLKSKRFDLVVNTTHDRFSSLLTYLLNAPEIRGMYLSADKKPKILVNGFWFRYLRCTSEFRQIAPFNLVDIYKNTTGGDSETRDLFFHVLAEHMSNADSCLGYNPDHEIRYIGFQLGTSTGNRRWPVRYFAELGNALQRDPKIRLVLLGTKEEECLGEEIMTQLENDPIDLIGKTDIPILAGVLKRLSILVTNDTGTMHLAEAVGTKCVALFFESANPFQTGPYGDGHFICSPDIECFPCSTVTQCDKKICLDLIHVETVSQLVKNRLYETDKDSINISEGTRVHESRSNGLGLWDAFPLENTTLTSYDLTRKAYRNMWLRHAEEEGYIDLNGGDSELQDALIKESELWSKYCIMKGDLLDNWLKEFHQVLDPLEKMADTGIALIHDIVATSNNIPFDGEAVTGKSEDLGKMDHEIITFGKSNIFLSQLAYLFDLELAQIEDSDFFRMLNRWKETYHLLRRRIGLLRNEINILKTIFH